MSGAFQNASHKSAGIAPWIVIAVMVFVFAALPGSAPAELLLGAEARVTIEENVVVNQLAGGRSAGGAGPMQTIAAGPVQAAGTGGQNRQPASMASSSSDISLTLSGEGGWLTRTGSKTSLFVKGFAEHTAYEKYSGLDYSIAGVSSGMNLDFSDRLSGRAAVFGKFKVYQDHDENSTAYGITFSLKEQIRKPIWLRQYLELEINDARLDLFSYTGVTIGASAGYALTRKAMLTCGLSIRQNDYRDRIVPDLTSVTLTFGGDYDMTRNWSAGVNLDLEEAEAGSTSATNTRLSAAVRYFY